MTRMKEKYQKEVVPALTKEFGYKNVMAVPKIQKIVVNMGLGAATAHAKIIQTGAAPLVLLSRSRAFRAPHVPAFDRAPPPFSQRSRA